jgi:hypothetical protein
MSPVKRSRKQRAAAAKAASKLKVPQEPVKKDFLADGRARFRAYLWTICVTFGYGFVNSLLLGRPENRVDEESVLVCVATLVGQVVFFYGRAKGGDDPSRFGERLWLALQQLSQRKFARIAAVSALALVLLASAIPLDAVNASLVKMIQKGRLPESVSRVAMQEVAYLQRYETRRQIAASDPAALKPISNLSTFQQANPAQGESFGRPGIIGQGVDKSVIILGPQAEAFGYTHPIPMIFSDFTVESFGHDPEKPVPQFLITSQGTSTDVVINNVKVVGLAQDIGNLTWTNDIFENCLIRYHGGPLRMVNVRFFNCSFELPPTMGGLRIFLDHLATHQGEPVNVYF